MLKYPWDIIGHNKQLLALENEIARDQLSHATIFQGPRNTGKFSVAFTLARILLCRHNLCHQCPDCQMIKSGIHPDLILMRDNGDSIKIDEIRALIQKTSLTSQGGLRVVLIETLERMPTEAQNSFLKTLEEPPGRTIFLMTVNQIKKVLPTILSRSRQVSFFLVDDTVMRQQLLERFKDHPDLDEVLQMAQGRPGLAIRLLSEQVLLSSYRNVYHQIEGMLKHNDLVGKFAYVESLETDKDGLELFFDVFSQIIRKAAYDCVLRGESRYSSRYDLREISQLFEYLLKTRYLIDRNANKKLALENFLLLTEK